VPDMVEIMTPATIAKPRPGNTRTTGKEQFYTPAELAAALVAEVAALVVDFAERTVLEPAGGTGAFVEAAKLAGAKKVLSFDIEPKSAGVIEADFLAINPELNDLSKAITISNPPFGRNNSLSIPFFNLAAKHSDVIAFIVPRSWRKWSVINRLDRNFELVSDKDLQIDYVDEIGSSIWQKNNLNTCFQIWRRSEKLRPLIRVHDAGLIERATPQTADVALTCFGFSCGKVSTDFARVPNTTTMFLRVHDVRALKALHEVDYSKFFRNTAYTEALSLPEVRYLVQEAVLGDSGLSEEH